MHQNRQSRPQQLADKFLDHWEGKVRRNNIAPLAGNERLVVLSVMEWMCKSYDVTPISGGLTQKQKEMIP